MIDETDKSGEAAVTPVAPAEKAGASPVAQPQAPKYGFYLDEQDEAKVAKRAEADWRKNAKSHKMQAAISKRNSYWREGRRFLRIEKAQDSGTIRIVQPLGIENLPPVPNLVDQLIRNATAILIADPPRPDCEPSRDTMQARDAAQAATRILTQLSTESGLNTDGVYEAAIDLSGTHGTGFVEVCYHPKGGGMRPMQIAAKADALTEDQAFTTPSSAPVVSKYVSEDGTLSDDATNARMQWEPKIVLNLLTPSHVRFLPRYCSGVEDAEGVVIGSVETFGQVKAKYEKVASMSPEQQWEVANWKCDDYKRLVPPDIEWEGRQGEKTSSDEPPPDDMLCCTLKVVYRSTPEYPYGCRLVVGGGKYVLDRGPNASETPTADGKLLNERLDINLAQFRWRRLEGNPYGQTDVEKLGPLDERRTSIFVGLEEYLFKANKPRPVLPMGTTTQPEDLADWEKPIFSIPNAKIEWFPLPPFSPVATEMLDRLKSEMMEIVGVTPIAMGQVAGSVRSAEQQKTSIEQSVVALSSLRESMQDGYERMHRLILQQIRAYWTLPMMLKYQTPDGAYQVEELQRTDLGDTSIVRVRRGTGTMMSPTAKSDMILGQMQAQMITPQEAQRLGRDNIAHLIGLQDNRAVKRIRRQLQQWRKGPPPEVAEAQPQPQLDPMGQPALDPMTGMPLPPVDPIAQAGQQVFAILPIDDEQLVAVQQHDELLEAVAEMDTYNFPPGWKDALVQRYLYSRQAAGIQTVAEQQMAMQQQAQQQQQQQGEERDA